jgi:hypothetical protein
MNCQGLEEAIVEVGRGRDVGRGTAAAVEAHVDHCEACAAKLARERIVSSGLRALAAATAGESPSPMLERQLQRAFAAHASAPGIRWWIPATAAAAATLALMAWWQGPRATVPGVAIDEKRETRAVIPWEPPPKPAPPSQSEDRKHLDRVEPGEQRRAIKSTPAAKSARGDTGFVALPAAIGLPDFESGVIVRMELPVAALPSYGIEVVSDSKMPVEADLLIGQDGQARAIRLVNRVTTRSGAEQ